MAGRTRRAGLLLALLALLAAAPLAVRAQQDGDAATAVTDEPDDPWAEADQPAAEPGFSVKLDGSGDAKPAAPARKPLTLKEVLAETWQGATLARLKAEAGVAAFFLLYITTIAYGRTKNRSIAREFADTFCRPGGLLDRNFAQVGKGEGKAREPLARESGSQWRVYCTGRRACKALEATLSTRPRHDLFGLLLGLVFPADDKVDVEIFMHEGAMPQLVLAVATKRLMKQMLREEEGEDDVRKLTRKVEPSRERAPGWPAGQLVVHAEQSSLFYEVLPEPLLEQLFGKAAWAEHGAYFRQLHITSEQAFGRKDQKAVLRLSLRLPPPGRMAELSRLLSGALALTDHVAGLKLSPEQRKRGEKLREDVSKADAKGREKREEAAEERRQAKRAEEQERMRRMTPEQREKYEQRRQKVEMGRQQRKYVRKG